MKAPAIIAVAGSSGSGKTCLIERLVPLLKKRGLRVGTVKHAHDRIDLDVPGKDSWRHLKAGAEAAAVVGPKQILTIRPVSQPALNGEALKAAIGALPGGLDLILLEGFHEAGFPQIVVERGGKSRRRRGGRLLAVVSDRPVKGGVRRFAPDQTAGLARFLEEEWRRRKWSRSTSQESSSAGV